MKNKHQFLLHDVTKSFDNGSLVQEVLKNISYSFDSEKAYTIMGSSGSGKSTLINLLAGIDNPTRGYVSFDEINIDRFSESERSVYLNNTIGLVFQEPLLLSELTVIENVMLKGRIGGKSYSQCFEHALELLKRVGLQSKALESPQSLSGGQQQRVAVLRAIYNKPSFLLADEPTGNLDDKTGKELIDLLLEYHHENNMGLIIASHDRQVAQSLNETINLHDGRLE